MLLLFGVSFYLESHSVISVRCYYCVGSHSVIWVGCYCCLESHSVIWLGNRSVVSNPSSLKYVYMRHTYFYVYTRQHISNPPPLTTCRATGRRTASTTAWPWSRPTTATTWNVLLTGGTVRTCSARGTETRTRPLPAPTPTATRAAEWPTATCTSPPSARQATP